MTSEVNMLKTNDFLRRRKLRLQQVREQSKDIAKKIRQRAKTEELRQVVELDAKKQQEYFQKQEKLVKRLEEFYARGIKNVGASHKNANELKSHDEQTDKVDISKQRGKEAAAELRRKRQEILDKQKKILDRKLQAREAANEKSREKSTTVANKVFSKTLSTVVEDPQNKKETSSMKDGKENEENITRNDMATQWEIDEIPKEWEPIPTLSLPKDDNISVKELNNNECKSDKSKRIDLFALSEEMPSSLRGTLTNEERVSVRPSVTLVSEYLQSRGMRLRETNSITSKKTSDELQSLRQTIMKTRTSREGSNVCHVHDIELVPVPSWQAGVNCGYCHTLLHKHCNIDKIASNYQISRAKPAQEQVISPTPILRGSSPFRRNKVCLSSFSAKGPNYQPSKASDVDSFYTVKKKNSVTMYNHTTRDMRHIPYEDDRNVIRHSPNDEDAYSQAMKETTSEDKTEKDLKKLQDIRSKVAMTKQNVEKEYRETMSFLNSLPKDVGNKPIRNAYMNEYRQEMQRENRQRKMQQEYKNIAKECRKHTCRNKSRNQSKSPVKDNYEMDFQYSWMPVPESDENLAIHTIPTSVKEGRSNSVKFSKIDSYHEYRSRHKHTPPTKDTTERSKHQNSSESDSVESDSTSEITLEEKKHKHLNLSDAERIIIYKILDSKKDKKTKKKLVKEIAQSLTMIDKSNVDENTSTKKSRSANSDIENKVTFEQVDEGVYKTVNQNGDNIASMYFHDREGTEIELTQEEIKYGKKCQCSKQTSDDKQKNQGGDTRHKTAQWESGDSLPLRNPNTSVECRCSCTTPKVNLKPATPKSQPIYTTQSNQKVLPSAATSTSSFRTATTDKANAASDGDYINLLDEVGQTGKFYIGASGLLKDDAYEVIIQLRKRGDERKDDLATSNGHFSKVSKIITPSTIPEASSTAENTQPSLEKVPIEKREIGIQNDTIASQVPSNDTRKVTVEVKDAASEIILTRNLDTVTTAVGTDDYENDITKTQEFKTVAEKGVSTSFQNSFAVPQNIPKTDSAPRPATSTYTQTSMSSPSHRPVFFHMSSSTSTAYMSPPDMILPKFLRQGYRLTDEDINDPRNYQRDSSLEDKLQEAPYCEYDCSCRKCTKERGDREFDSRKRKAFQTVRAPPNTARCTKDADQSDNERGSVTSFKKKRKEKCRKCKSRSSLDGVKSRSSKRSIPVSKHSSRNLNVGYSNASSRANKLKLSKSNLNPIVKKYVNKLLSLNRESLKAVEVMDQDCSTVPTPGSSIINDNNNVLSNHHIEQKISLEQIKDILKQQILKECLDRCKKNYSSMNKNDVSSSCNFSDTCLRKKSNKSVNSKPSQKKIHKVKSLNISKHLLKIKRSDSQQRTKLTSSSSSPKENDKEPIQSPSKSKTRSSSSPTPRGKENIARKSATKTEKIKSTSSLSQQNTESKVGSTNTERKSKRRPYSATSPSLTNRAVTTSDSDLSAPPRDRKQDSLTNISTQTIWHADSELNFVKLAQSKIQNMEKIADLTEKCTKRLSNLAKVLEEVRKNKSLAYSHISSGNSSDSEQKPDKNTNKFQQYYDKHNLTAPETTDSQSCDKNKENKDTSDSSNYIPYLSDIPKPAAFKNLNTSQLSESSSGSSKKSASPPPNADQQVKNRARPPPALSRVHLKNGQDYVIPHELSTVIEVDSPLSVKLRNQGSRHDLELPEINNTIEKKTAKINERNASPNRQVDATNANANLMPDNCSSTNLQQKRAATESSDDSKIQMIELRQFNEIMLKPFFSIQEYAKRYNIETLDDGSNVDDGQKDDVVNDEMSSLHSDASLPDVISELLKRNLITEPFKFDTASNVNSTTISSESTLSVLALSRAKKEKKKSSVMFQNKENVGETSDTLSMSSNPDLENAFKKLGMGWASSTLKKTKERLALSSSSNTSSSSLSQFKIKSFSQDIPAIVTDTVSSVVNGSKPLQRRNTVDTPRNAEQQTSLTNTMTVKEFLTKELAKKITFDNKSKNEVSEEFVSLFETKLPDEMQQSRAVREENSIDNSVRSGNRARTSTPVQLYKSMTYHSSSSSNISNGLFSNADDLSSVKGTSNSMKHSTSDKDDLTIPNVCLKMKRVSSECSKSD